MGISIYSFKFVCPGSLAIVLRLLWLCVDLSFLLVIDECYIHQPRVYQFVFRVHSHILVGVSVLICGTCILSFRGHFRSLFKTTHSLLGRSKPGTLSVGLLIRLYLSGLLFSPLMSHTNRSFQN